MSNRNILLVAITLGFISLCGHASTIVENPSEAAPPEVKITSPNSNVLIATRSTMISATYADDEGVKTESVIVLLDNKDISAFCLIGKIKVSCPIDKIEEGLHSLSVRVNDLSGNFGIDSQTFLQVNTESKNTDATWHSGTGEPVIQFGENKDFYLDFESGDVFQKVGGAWLFLLNIVTPIDLTGQMREQSYSGHRARFRPTS